MPADALVPLTTRIETTADEAQLVALWCRDHHARRIIVVTSSFHTKRAGYIFDWALDGRPVEVLVHAAPLDAFKPDSWWKSGWTLRMGIIEMQKTLYYRVRYW